MKSIFRLLRSFCPDHLYEEIEGDLLQMFERDEKQLGEKRAKRRLLWNVIRFFRSGIILKGKFSIELNQGYMIKNYFVVLFRSAMKRKFYTVINILCLTVGISFALLIGIFVYEELEVNQSLGDIDRLYLVQSKTRTNEDLDFYAPTILTKHCIDRYPQVFQSQYQFLDRNITVSKGDKHLRIQSMIGDYNFIKFFGFEVLKGDVDEALNEPNSIVVTETTAKSFFNTLDVINETLVVSTEQNGRKEYKITAVIKNPEDKNSVTDFMNMDAQIFLSLKNYKDFFPQFNENSWNDYIISYVKLSPNVPVAEAEMTINKMVLHDAPKENSDGRTFILSSLKEYYLITNHGAVQKMVVSLIAIVILVLLLAISNFINISIASSVSRFKEVGVRKVIGSLRTQVITQFLLESIFLSIVSGILAILTYQLLHQYFGELLDASLPSIFEFEKQFWFIIFSGVFLTGFLAGIYPAIFQSLAKPIDSLKGKFKSVQGTLQFSRVLIGIQFLITIFIFIGAVVLSNQASYFLEKDLGYNKSHVLIVNSVPRSYTEAGFQKMESAKNEFLRSPKVQSVSLSMGAPGWSFSPGGGKLFKAENSSDHGINYTVTGTDENFPEVYDLKIVEGRYFDRQELRIPNEVVINQTAQKALGLKIGDHVKASNFGDAVLTIGGVIQDFNFDSLHEKVAALMIVHNKDFEAYRFFSFKIAPGRMSESVLEVERVWKDVFPEDAFNFSFADERLKTLYTTEIQMKKAASVATVLMLIIVVTGVLGLVSLNVSKRTKEIGIRKVLGASLSSILTLLASKYAILMITSFMVAAPLTYFLAMRWLEGFAYHIELDWWMFVAPGCILMLVILAIVAVQAFKAASTNPVNSLKND